MRVAQAEGADLAEIRIDHLSESELAHWRDIVSSKSIPIIVTNRASWEGGHWRTDDETRLNILADAEQLGAEYIDVELASAQKFAQLRSTPSAKLILSHHNFSHSLTTPEIDVIRSKMRQYNADVHKIAVMPTTARDIVPILIALRSAREPTIALAMGALGQVTRVAAAAFGAHLTFACARAGSESAPGQVSTKRLSTFFGFRFVTPTTRLFGIIGYPVEHSMSPALHNTSMRITGADGLYVYLPVDTDVATYIREMCDLGFCGFSVTIPHKLDAINAVDHVDPTARRIGAINTVVRRSDGSLAGYNTDWVAAMDAIEHALPDRSLLGKRVLCIGAGGAGRALAFGALARGATHLLVVNRSPQRAVALAEDLGVDRAVGMSLDHFFEADNLDYDVIMNSTSVGMHPNVGETPIPREKLRSKPLVFDAVYNPLETRLLKEAKAAGCVIVSGLEMFVRQAAEQFRLWHPGVEPPIVLMRQVVLDNLRAK